MPNPEVPSEAFPQTAASIHARAICNYLLEIPNLHEDVVSASEWAGVKQLNDWTLITKNREGSLKPLSAPQPFQ